MKHDEIVSILCELYNISGFRVSLHGTDFEEIAAYPAERLPFCSAIQKSPREYARCVACDSDACRRVEASGETLIYKCRYGLTEAVSPLYNFGTLTGYLMMGQISDTELNTERLSDTASKTCGSDRSEMRRLAMKIPRHSQDMINSYVKIMTICAEYITLINALPSQKPTVAEMAKLYLLENYHRHVTINDICKALGCSKSTLLAAFKSENGITINNYLCEIRIEEAKKLLSGSEMSINEIADATGFYDQSYFSKVFSQKEGSTPSEYRKGTK